MSKWGDIDSFCTQYGFYHENPIQDILTRRQEIHQQNVPMLSDEAPHGSVDCVNDTEMLGHEGGNGKANQKLSTEQILKLAGERFLRFSSGASPAERSVVVGASLLSAEDKQDVELAQLLLAAAEKVSGRQVESARKLLGNCRWIASSSGTPVQRAVFYFAEALAERIDGGTGRSAVSEEEEGGAVVVAAKPPGDACSKGSAPAFTGMYRNVPFYQILHLTAVQTILESVGDRPRVHVVDFHMMSGTHWAAFMKSWADRMDEAAAGGGRSGCRLAITAVAAEGKDSARDAGVLLRNFARCLDLPFSYRVVVVDDMADLKEEDLGVEPDEGVAVIFPFRLRTLISKPACLKNLMKVVQQIKPSVMVVEEVEANHNSPSFVNRFVEALFFYGALFDSLEDGTARDNLDRMAIESGVYRKGLRNIVAAEGVERETRSVSLRVWRAFFARFGMIELELSTASLSQACMILNQFPCGESCTLDISSKCMIVGWKGTPLFSLSAWKFH